MNKKTAPVPIADETKDEKITYAHALKIILNDRTLYPMMSTENFANLLCIMKDEERRFKEKIQDEKKFKNIHLKVIKAAMHVISIYSKTSPHNQSIPWNRMSESEREEAWAKMIKDNPQLEDYI
jgi:hypothetical protein